MLSRLANLRKSRQTSYRISRVEQLVGSSSKALKDCSLENGAIVAANSDKKYYPNNVSDYRFIWPRDVGYILYAADILGMNQMADEFYNWLFERAEGFKDSGIIYHRYTTNGPRDTDFGHQFQPDQAATLLWSILETNDSLNAKQRKIVHLLGDGLWSQWGEKHFHKNTYDIWEERECHSDLGGNFTYSLAACSEALYKAAERINEDKWYRTAEKMRERLEEHHSYTEDGRVYYPRTWGDMPDDTVDAANLGLIWPFNVVDNDEKLINTVELIEERCMTDRGVMRYQDDMYDGMVSHTKHLKKGAGAWPLLTFWYAIGLDELGRTKEARRIFQEQLNQIEGNWIPEQIFDNDGKVAIKPLAWSHAMFVIAGERLGEI